MLKKLRIPVVLACLMLSSFSSAAIAEDQTPLQTPQIGLPPQENQRPDAGELEKMPFDQRKAMILSRLEQRQTRLTEAAACVKAAADQESLRACREKMRPEGKCRRGHGPYGQPDGIGAPGTQNDPRNQGTKGCRRIN